MQREPGGTPPRTAGHRLAEHRDVRDPTLQARRYDPNGDYVRRWVPELAGARAPGVYEPWRLDARARRGYPLPLVDHDEARARFLGLA